MNICSRGYRVGSSNESVSDQLVQDPMTIDTLEVRLTYGEFCRSFAIAATCSLCLLNLLFLQPSGITESLRATLH
jgi:hypothetical protein